MSSIKIALIVPEFPKLSETFIVNKFVGLAERGIDVHVFCGRRRSKEWRIHDQLKHRNHLKKRVHSRLPVHPIWLVALLYPVAVLRTILRNPIGFLSYLNQGWRLFGIRVVRNFYLDHDLIAFRPDIIHFEFGTMAVNRCYLKDLVGSRIIVSFRGYDINYIGLDYDSYYRDIWDKANALHLLGKDLWKRAVKRGCPETIPHFFIAPAIDTSRFDPGSKTHSEVVGTKERTFRILSVGRLVWKKGYEYNLQAIRLLVDSGINCEYRIIGEGEDADCFAFARYQLALVDSVVFLGAKTGIEVIDAMMEADVLLHGAVSEGFCNSVLEAQAMRLPVVCSNADGLSENVEDGVTGFVVPRRDSGAMAEKLRILAQNPELRNQMAAKGRDRVVTHFRVEDQVQKIASMYDAVYGKHVSSR